MFGIQVRSESSSAFSSKVIGSYFDRLSGCRFVVARPAEQPELWLAYLEGARHSYRRHDVETVLQYDEICDGQSTAIFVSALGPDGKVAGGMRVQGPYRSADQAHAMLEWAGQAGEHEVRREISGRIPAGVVEMKTGWVNDEAVNRRAITVALARIFVHALGLMGVRYAFGTVASHAVKRWETSGGVVCGGVEPVAYPDDRYRTVLMWWDRETYADLAVLDQLPAIMEESAQLAASSQSILPSPFLVKA